MTKLNESIFRTYRVPLSKIVKLGKNERIEDTSITDDNVEINTIEEIL